MKTRYRLYRVCGFSRHPALMLAGRVPEALRVIGLALILGTLLYLNITLLMLL